MKILSPRLLYILGSWTGTACHPSQFDSFKLLMPKQKFSLVDYVNIKKIALRAA